MRNSEANDGDDGCPWGVAPAAAERPFFGNPIRCGPFVKLPQFIGTHALVACEARSRLDPPGSCGHRVVTAASAANAQKRHLRSRSTGTSGRAWSKSERRETHGVKSRSGAGKDSSSTELPDQ
jgi:hypothetical protein